MRLTSCLFPFGNRIPLAPPDPPFDDHVASLEEVAEQPAEEDAERKADQAPPWGRK